MKISAINYFKIMIMTIISIMIVWYIFNSLAAVVIYYEKKREESKK